MLEFITGFLSPALYLYRFPDRWRLCGAAQYHQPAQVDCRVPADIAGHLGLYRAGRYRLDQWMHGRTGSLRCCHYQRRGRGTSEGLWLIIKPRPVITDDGRDAVDVVDPLVHVIFIKAFVDQTLPDLGDICPPPASKAVFCDRAAFHPLRQRFAVIALYIQFLLAVCRKTVF